MRLLFLVVLVLAFGVAVALLARDDPGYVLIAYQGWTAETSLALIVVALGLAFGVFYTVTRLLIRTVHVPRGVGEWRSGRRRRRARDAFTRGLLALSEAHWDKAERLLLKDVAAAPLPALNYLAAARAAQRSRDYARRDDYLRLASESAPNARLAAGIARAELQLDHHEFEQALATLLDLRREYPKHQHVLNLLLRLHIKLGEWGSLLEILPKLTASGVVKEEERRQLEINSYARLMANAVTHHGLEELRQVWQRLPRKFRHEEQLVLEYCYYLMTHGAAGEAETILAKAIKHKWDDELVYLYGMVHGPDLGAQLARAETWLAFHESNAVLLLTLGRLCARNELWGKARQYLEASAHISRQPETYKELGELLERMGKNDAAMECYKKGLVFHSERSASLGSLGRSGRVESLLTPPTAATT